MRAVLPSPARLDRAMRGAGVAVFLLLAGLGALAQAHEANQSGGTRVYRTPFYELHTDLPELEAREAVVRMTAMAHEYSRRLSQFQRSVPSGLTFKLFADLDSYHHAGGTPGSAGQFNSRTGMLMAYFGPGARRWHVIQHEGFHQFAHHAIGPDLPPWLGEGMAEYFAEAAFTGDSFVVGLIPPTRLARIQEGIERGRFKPIEQIMQMPLEDWNGQLQAENYDQAWSMVHFLIHGQEGRYRERFEQFIGLCSRGREWTRAWQETFGAVDGFEQAWRRWWLSQTRDATADLGREATLRKLVSFWGRAVAQGQRVGSFAHFAQLAEAGQLAYHDAQWLPPDLLREALAEAKVLVEQGATFELREVRIEASREPVESPEPSPRQPPQTASEMVLRLPDGTLYRGRFDHNRRLVTGVYLQVDRPGAAPRK